jgi:hypothetical protein
MSRAEKLSALADAWERELYALHGFRPRAVDRRDHMRFLMQVTNAQLDSALEARGINPVTGATPRQFIW